MSTSSGFSDSKSAMTDTTSKTELESFDPRAITVMVVDYDKNCLEATVKELQCFYAIVMGCNKAIDALSMLRKFNHGVDIILVDAEMPEMDGFRFLEIIGLEMSIPVILMSVQGENAKVLKAVTHGAVDYFIKPLRNEELKNIWQHVYRKLVMDKVEQSAGKTGKKPRMIWTPELHQRFVDAVNELGVEEAVPKKIKQLMGVPFLKREHIASHLQKYRLYLRSMPNVHSGGIPMFYGGGNEMFSNTPGAGSSMQSLSMSPGSSFISSNDFHMHSGNQFSPYSSLRTTGAFNNYNLSMQLDRQGNNLSSPMDTSKDQ